jgi:hypothetical protein
LNRFAVSVKLADARHPDLISFSERFAMKPVRLLLILAIAGTVSCGGGSSSSSNNGGGSGGGGTGAISWQRVSTPFSQVAFVDFGSNGHWFIADRAQGFQRSTDGGSTWTAVNSGIATNFGWTINVVPSNGDLIAGIYSPGGPGLHPVGFYRSSDEGNSWASIQSGQLDASPAWTGCAFAANSNVVCGGYWAASPASGGWYSRNAGQTVAATTTATTNGSTTFSLALNPADNSLWMGTEQYGIFRSTDNGATWSSASPPDTNIDSVNGIKDGNVFAITFDSSGNVLFGSQGGIWKSSSSGSALTWKNVKSNNNTADGIALGRDTNGTLYYGHRQDSSDPTTIYCSTDDGNTWKGCATGVPQSQEVFRFVLNHADGKMYAVVRDLTTDTGALYRTVNPVR